MPCSLAASQGLPLCFVLKYLHTKHQHTLRLYNGSDNALGESRLSISRVLELEEEGSRQCASFDTEQV